MFSFSRNELFPNSVLRSVTAFHALQSVVHAFQLASRMLWEYLTQCCVRALRLVSCSQAFNARAVYIDTYLFIHGRDYIRAEARGHRRDTELVEAAFRLH